jgi:hypothetical protein
MRVPERVQSNLSSHSPLWAAALWIRRLQNMSQPAPKCLSGELLNQVSQFVSRVVA